MGDRTTARWHAREGYQPLSLCSRNQFRDTMLVPSLLLFVIVVYANEDEGVQDKDAMILDSNKLYSKRASVIPFSGGMYGKRSDIREGDEGESPLYGWIDTRTTAPHHGGYDKRQFLSFSRGLHSKQTAMPFSGGFYGKRTVIMPFSGGFYGKRSSSPYIGNFYDKRSDRYIRSPMPISGGFFG